jgi:hypothetical protein
MISGFMVRQRAIAMRWRWPPENSCGYLPKASARQAHFFDQGHRTLSALAIVLANAVDAHGLHQDLADGEARVQAGVGVLKDDLDAAAVGRIWAALSVARSMPSNMMLPAVAGVRRVSIMPMVVLPEPDSPTTPRVRPLCREKLALLTALNTLRLNRPVLSG